MTSPYQHNGLSGADYYYRVAALHGLLEGPLSNEVHVSPGRAGGICSGAGWCYEHPASPKGGLVAIWGSSSNDVWTADGISTVLHWDGASWSAQTQGLTPPSGHSAVLLTP